MESGPYSVGAVAIAVAILVFIVVRVRRAARSKSGSVFTSRRSRSRSTDDGMLAARSLAEMLHYYAPHEDVTLTETPTDEATRNEETSRPPLPIEPIGQAVLPDERLHSKLPVIPMNVRVHSATAPAPPSGHGEDRLVAPMPAAQPRPGGLEGADDSPSIVMGAPVEVWFEGARMGVKAGTETHERFRKCADALLHDLKAARSASR